MLLLPTSQNSECQILEIPLYNTDANRPKKIANGISHYPLTDRANRKLWPERFTTNKQTSIQLDESIFSTNSISSNSEKEERKNGRGIEIVEKRESNLHFAIGPDRVVVYISEVAFVKRRPVAFVRYALILIRIGHGGANRKRILAG